ncbi:MAG: helix-turn-helix transcriptional regulator [Gammaproteobacteria bacterium]
MKDKPIVSGGTRGSYVFEHHRVAPGEMDVHVFDDHMFLLPLGAAAVRFDSHLNGRRVTGAFKPGRFRFLAAGDRLATRWNESLECILVALHPDTIHRALGEEVCSAPSELVSNILPHDDPMLTHLILTMESYLNSGRRAGRLFEQSLLATIAAHLLCVYGSGRKGHSRAATLTHWKRIQVEEHVRRNLSRNIGLNEIAQAVNLSPYHLSRSFRATTGQGLWQFVLECRVQEAMRMIRAGRSSSLADTAHACGFEGYSQFIAAFRKFLGQLPSEHCASHRRSHS